MNQHSMNIGSNSFHQTSSGLGNIGINQFGGTSIPLAGSSGPPPIPPRRQVNSYQPYNSLNAYGSSYMPTGGYGYGSGYYNRYGGLGSYGNYGLLGYGQSQWGGGPSGDVENRFVQYAEESTRPAFQSIEAMVHTFSSMTMMLESTFFAMTSSFRAILGVAENMGKLRSMLKHFVSTFALFRFIKWLYWRTKYLMGVKKLDVSSEALWQETVSDVLKDGAEQAGPTAWPIFVFLGFLFATPYLIHRLVRSAKNIDIDVKNPKSWTKCKDPIHTATALYNFIPASSEELPLRIGQKIYLAPQSLQPKNSPGWWRAADTVNVGLIPSNYVKVIGQLIRKSENIDNSANIPQNIDSSIDTTVLDEEFRKDTQSENKDFPKLENSNEQLQ